MRKLLITILTVLVLSPLAAQEEYADIRRGNRAYDREDYAEAEVNYRRALQKNPNSFAATYNLGNALLRQEKYDEAAKQYIRATTQVKAPEDADKLAKAYHNLGNSYFVMQDYDNAIKAYQQSLRLNPKDNDTRYNLVKAMQMKKQQQQQPQEQPQEQQQQQNQMDQQTAEQLLQALEQDEQEAQEKAQRQQQKKKELEKNW